MLASAPLLATAQDSEFNGEVFRTISMIFVLAMFMLFILAIMKKIMDHRVRRKLLEKSVPESLVNTLLHTEPVSAMSGNVKWFLLLLGAGIALTLIHRQLPLGIHSIAIMAFCLSGSFLCYFLFLRFVEKQK